MHSPQITEIVLYDKITNVLDLGVWCSLQTKVERAHYMKRCESKALDKSVNYIWNNDQ